MEKGNIEDMKTKGSMIVFEGLDGSGKTLCLDRIARALEEKGYSVVRTREPGGNAQAEQIRELIFSQELLPETEALLFAAARNEHFHRTLLPALESGKIVLSDRFLHSSLAYQGHGRELGESQVERLNDWFLKGFRPDLVLWFDCPSCIRKERMGSRDENNRLDREKEAFYERIEKGYESRAGEMKRIDAGRDADTVFEQAMRAVEEILNG